MGINRNLLNRVTAVHRKGQRIQLVADSEGHSEGAIGTIQEVVGIGRLKVQWEDGTSSELDVGVTLFDKVIDS